MKSITNYITEASQQQPTTLFVESLSGALLFEYELSGQISDGKWENSRPANHWKWITDVDFEITHDTDNLGYVGPKHRIKYDCSWLMNYFNKAEKGNQDYQWAYRFLNYGKAGLVFGENDLNKIRNYAYRAMIEHMPLEKVTKTQFEESFKYDYMKKYWEQVKGDFTPAFFKKWYSTSYTKKDLGWDIQLLAISINIQKTDENA